MLKTMTSMSDWHCRWRRRTETSPQKRGGITGIVLDPKKIVEGAKQALSKLHSRRVYSYFGAIRAPGGRRVEAHPNAIDADRK